MIAQLRIPWPTASELWTLADSQDPLCTELADGHYSRQTPGSARYMGPGQTLALHHRGSVGSAVWGVLLNLDPVGALRWRNTIFRNTSSTISSVLIAAATFVTYQEWIARYDALPDVPLTTEVDIEATKRRRSKHKEPGVCYREAGWREVRRTPREHGRSAKVVLEAPR